MKKILLPYLLLVIFHFTSCTSESVMDDPDYYRSTVLDWINRSAKNIKDYDAFKNLGIYYVQLKEHDKATYYLDRALDGYPNDPALYLYKGLNLEFLNNFPEAFNMYKKYPEVPADSPYRELLEGRYNWLNRQKIYSEIDSMAAITDNLFLSDDSDSTLAVFPLIYNGTNPDYEPLSRGFSEMISIDLAKVKELTVLERVRIQAVIDELKFSQTPLVDQSSAPRAGRLLKAGTIVSGDFDISPNDEFKINLGSWDAKTSDRKLWVNASGDLNDLFELQKRVVFNFLEKTGIELTLEEKEAIAYIPTQNLDAFLAYSRGLLEEDQGNYSGASSFFQNASQSDPQFKPAETKLKSTQASGKVSGSGDQVINNLKTIDPAIKGESINISDNRNRNLDNNLSSNFLQGIDTRNPAQEFGTGVLPLPPPPPSR